MNPLQVVSNTQNLILIVDDTPSNLAVISATLSDAEFEVAIATNGERALEQIQLEPPDLILLDIMMPGIGGFEVCRRIKADPKFKDIPIIFMTANSDLSSKVEGLKLGAVDYITKPFEEREVIARIKTHLELKNARLQLQLSQQRLNQILCSIREVIWSADLNPFRLIYLNPVVKDIFGYPEEEFVENSDRWLEMIHPDDQSLMKDYISNPADGKSLDTEYRIIKPNQEIYWLHCQAKMSWQNAEKQFRIDGVLRDISDRKKVEQQLLRSAQCDNLTNLANRAYFIAQLNTIMSLPEADRKDSYALLFIDLDRFKAINDTLGHKVGDQLLIHVGNILQKSTREYDLVARLGGDEFTILLTKLGHPNEAALISDRILTKLKETFEIEEHSISISASIGIVVDFSPYQTTTELLHHADLAMYQAKRSGKACHQIFEPKIYEQALAKERLEQELKAAIQGQDLLLFYQPIRILKDNKLKGFEALMRWQHPTQGMIPPSTFIPLAEETGLILALGERLIQLACEQLVTWKSQYPDFSELTINLNISGKQLQQPNFLQILEQTLAFYSLTPQNFELEITESSLMEANEEVLQRLNALRQKGFRLSLDDFGTGYSSLSYLHRFPINTLKIDRSFVQSMGTDSHSTEIVRTILALAQTLEMRVVAEGVETAEQAATLESLQCEMVQGYFFARPLNSEAATQYLFAEYENNSSRETA